MSDTVQLVPSVPVVTRPVQVRPDQIVEPAKNAQTENRSQGEGDHASHGDHANRHLTISRSDKLGTFVYRSIDGQSGDVLWQYPAENMLRMAQQWRDLEARTESHQVDEKA